MKLKPIKKQGKVKQVWIFIRDTFRNPEIHQEAKNILREVISYCVVFIKLLKFVKCLRNILDDEP